MLNIPQYNVEGIVWILLQELPHVHIEPLSFKLINAA